MAASPAPPFWAHLTDLIAASLLALVGGFIDAMGYLAFFGLFTTSITGNLIVAAAAAAQHGSVGPRLVLTATFMGGAALGSVLAFSLKRWRGMAPRQLARLLLLLEILILVVYWAVGYAKNAEGALTDIQAPAVQLLGALASMAMGVQNSATREALVGYPLTTVMTGTLVNATSTFVTTAMLGLALLGVVQLPTTAPKHDMVNTSVVSGSGSVAAASKDADDAQHAEVRRQFSAASALFIRTGLPLVSFFIGALLGAFTYSYGGFNCLGLPVGVLLILLLELSCPLRPTGTQP